MEDAMTIADSLFVLSFSLLPLLALKDLLGY
jgi:hypothetical protein